MSFANHNILDIALSVIPPTVVKIRKNLGTVVNKYGQSAASYSDWVSVYGIVQPGGQQNEHTEGIDFSKRHVTIWLRGVALDGTHIQWAPDQILFVGSIFNVTSVKDWYPYDNYRECDCVEAMNLASSQRSGDTREVSEVKEPKQVNSREEEQVIEQINKKRTEILAKPSIFKKDDESVCKIDDKPVDKPKKKSLVGKAIIKF